MNIWVNGCFDILHIGHLNLLEYAKNLRDPKSKYLRLNRLIVGIDSDKLVKTVRKPDDIFQLPLSVLYFITDKFKYKDKITEKRLYQFKSTYELKEYATAVNDVEILLSLKLVEDYGFDLENLRDYAKKYHAKRTNIDVYLTTAHSGKGLEFDHVIVKDDFPDLMQLLATNKIDSIEDFHHIKEIDPDSVKKITEEFNLFYVAITRGLYSSTVNGINNTYLDMTVDELNEKLADMKESSPKKSGTKKTIRRRSI